MRKRNPIARELRDARYAKRVTRNEKRYTRKVKHKGKETA